MSDSSKPAFPQPHPIEDGNGNFHYVTEPGMTLREYAAVAAMQGLLANPIHGTQVHNFDGTSELAVRHADALLAKLEERKP